MLEMSNFYFVISNVTFVGPGPGHSQSKAPPGSNLENQPTRPASQWSGLNLEIVVTLTGN